MSWINSKCTVLRNRVQIYCNVNFKNRFKYNKIRITNTSKLSTEIAIPKSPNENAIQSVFTHKKWKKCLIFSQSCMCKSDSFSNKKKHTQKKNRARLSSSRLFKRSNCTFSSFPPWFNRISVRDFHLMPLIEYYGKYIYNQANTQSHDH